MGKGKSPANNVFYGLSERAVDCRVWANLQSAERGGFGESEEWAGGCRKEKQILLSASCLQWPEEERPLLTYLLGRKTAGEHRFREQVFGAYHAPCSWKVWDQKRKKQGPRSPNFLRPPRCFQLLYRRKKFCLWDTSLWAVEALSKKAQSLH